MGQLFSKYAFQQSNTVHIAHPSRMRNGFVVQPNRIHFQHSICRQQIVNGATQSRGWQITCRRRNTQNNQALHQSFSVLQFFNCLAA